MQNKARSQNIITYTPRPRDIEAKIRRLAENSKNVWWSARTHETHAESRMNWRGITDKMMFEVLRTGYQEGEIVAGKNPGEWKTKMVKKIKGNREVGVVTIVIKNKKLFVKTVEWEDL